MFKKNGKTNKLKKNSKMQKKRKKKRKTNIYYKEKFSLKQYGPLFCGENCILWPYLLLYFLLFDKKI
jgi:hypothetical protein